jgi:hypothetical protein
MNLECIEIYFVIWIMSFSFVFLFNAVCLGGKASFTNFIVFDLNRRSYHTRSKHTNHYNTGRVSDCCSMPTQQFFSYIGQEQVNFQWDNDEVYFVLDQHT